jgi:aminomethyltransferase
MQRNSVLNERHRQLGSLLDGETWNNMPLPWSYSTNAHDEVVATRTCAGLYDVTALNLINVSGKDAASVLDQLVSIEISRLKPGSARLAAEVDEQGALVDDIMVIRDGEEAFRLSHGGGKTKEHLACLAEGKDVKIEPDLDVHILSLQGPKSLQILSPHAAPGLETLPYFQHISTTLFGISVIISRGGYSGELGYEVYCASKDAVFLWDQILAAGKPFGAMAASWNALELTRIEGALMFFPFEMPEGDTTPWEVNMSWAIDLDKKGNYIGKDALLKLRGRERIKLAGIICDVPHAVEAGSKLWIGSQEVGVVTSASYSRYLMQSLALVHLLPAYTALGTRVMVKGTKAECFATVVKTPFYDPLRQRTHGKH